jgi:serine/threonine protein kinase
MSLVHALDDTLLRRLPLPLAQLYLRAQNAKAPIERHLAAYYLWEGSLKLLGSAAVVTYADLGRHDAEIVERLKNLARPALGRWWELVRLLLPALAEAGDDGFAAARDLVLGKVRDDLPRAAGLDACLREALDGRAAARPTVRLSELFERLVRYRNGELGHGAAGQAAAGVYERVGTTLLLGVAEVLGRLDVLAGRRLVYVAEVRRQVAGDWLVEKYDLTAESARRLPSLALPASAAAALPHPERVYLGRFAEAAGEALAPLHPLVTYEPETAEAFFLNARRGAGRGEYLCYTTGRVADRRDCGAEQRELLARVLGLAVDEAKLAEWAARSRPEEPPAPAPEAAAGASPRRVGEFEIVSELGRGGMGVVYRAWQPSLGRRVALKSLLRAGDPKAEARFNREICALGRVEHPHLVKVFMSGVDGDRWYYAMELVEGADLGSVCERLAGSTASAVSEAVWARALTTACEEAHQKERTLADAAAPAPPRAASPAPLPAEAAPRRTATSHVRQVVEVVRQVAEAAHALHEAGVIHRDIKPGNVLLTPDGAHAVLMDLGLARLADAAEGRLTRTRQFVGTLRYASPEQVLAVGKVDRRSDVYSLGATLWELLTLRPLYGATEQTPTPELMRRTQHEEPRRVRALNPRVPRGLEAIVLKCLEKDAARRYRSAAELADDLRRFLGGEPVQARPVSDLQRLWRLCRRYPALAALVGALVLAITVGLAVASRKWYEASVAQGLAEEHARAATAAHAEEVAARTRAESALYFNRIALAQGECALAKFGDARKVLDQCPPGLRHWEWHYLDRLCESGPRQVSGHAGAVYAVAFSPDGTRLASASQAGTVKVWDVATGEELTAIRGHGDSVWALSFSPDGARLASASWDRTVRVWDFATGRLLLTFRGDADDVQTVAFSPDGRRIASGGERPPAEGLGLPDRRGVAEPPRPRPARARRQLQRGRPAHRHRRRGPDAEGVGAGHGP